MMQSELSTIVTYDPSAIAGDTTLGDLADLLNSSRAKSRLLGVVTEEMVLRTMLDAMRS